MIRFRKKFRRCIIILIIVLGVVYAIALVNPGITLRSVECPDFSGIPPHFQSFCEKLAPQWQMVLDIPAKLKVPLEKVIQVYEAICNIL